MTIPETPSAGTGASGGPGSADDLSLPGGVTCAIDSGPMSRSAAHHAARGLPPGTPAPDFRLRRTPDQDATLAGYRGQPVILAFYPADWSPVCGDQMVLYNEILPEFEQHGAALLGISVDGAWCHHAYAQHNNLRFPLLADFEPKGAVARAYRVYREDEGIAERALFVIDGEGVIRWSHVSPIGVNPGAEGILAALEALATPTEGART